MTLTTHHLVPAAAGTDQGWTGLHQYLRWAPERVDRHLLDVVGPQLTALRAAGAFDDWFFLRYAEGGPHLRIRVRGASAATATALVDVLQAAVPDADGAHGAVRAVPYEPETARYGGPRALPVAEDLFGRSTELALHVLAVQPDRAARLGTVLDLWIATAAALELDTLGTVRWLRAGAAMWRRQEVPGLLPGRRVLRAAEAAAATQSAAVRRRRLTVTEAARAAVRAGGDAGTGPVATRWAVLVHRARAALAADPAGPPGPAHQLGIWASQLHMLCNRIGILPDEERATAALLAACLLDPADALAGDFFAAGDTAPDLRYLAGSRFELGRMDGQAPRPAPPAGVARPFPPGPARGLPPARHLPAGLADALDRRTSGRGDLGGRLTAVDVATLLRGAAGSSPRRDPVPGGTRRRPYPAAGARYVARLRLAALAVDGVPPGLYDVDEDTTGPDPTGVPVLRGAGPAPDADDLVAASMWFTPGPAGATGRIDATTVPAVLALSVDLGALRAAYGQRALRFALLEAGHLAQNLALVAAATGLATTTVGGFYDDVAHEVFLLDGVDEVLAYLLPLGRRR